MVLFSGKGTNLQNLILSLHNRTFEKFSVEIAAALTNNPEAKGIRWCQEYDVPCQIIDHHQYDSVESFDRALVEEIQTYQPDLVCLAGFMRILSPVFTDAVKALNLHPSLLPLFKGAHGIRESFESGMKVGGVSVHWVEAELDAGQIIVQVCVPKKEDDTLESFTQRIHEMEYQLYPQAILGVLASQDS